MPFDITSVLTTSVQSYITLFFLLATRFYGALALLPFFRNGITPTMAQFAIIITFCLMLLPLYDSQQLLQQLPQGSDLLFLFLREAFIGFGFGLITVLIFVLAQSIGDFIDNQRGAAMASMFDPLANSQSSPTGLFLAQVFTVVFILTGGLEELFALLLSSYQAVPLLDASLLDTSGKTVVDNSAIFLLFREMFSFYAEKTVLLAAPVVTIMLASEIAFALVSRFAPQLNVFILSMPVKSAIAFFVLLFYMGIMMQHLITNKDTVFDKLKFLSG